eukprot:431386-Pleurochrysis_carterae.AAC.3
MAMLEDAFLLSRVTASVCVTRPLAHAHALDCRPRVPTPHSRALSALRPDAPLASSEPQPCSTINMFAPLIDGNL